MDFDNINVKEEEFEVTENFYYNDIGTEIGTENNIQKNIYFENSEVNREFDVNAIKMECNPNVIYIKENITKMEKPFHHVSSCIKDEKIKKEEQVFMEYENEMITSEESWNNINSESSERTLDTNTKRKLNATDCILDSRPSTSQEESFHIKGRDDSYQFGEDLKNKSQSMESQNSQRSLEYSPSNTSSAGLYHCSDCNYNTLLFSNFIRHSAKHKAKKVLQCKHCDYRTSQRSNFVVHNRTHTGEKPYKCSVCDYSASQKSLLDNHVGIHTGDRPFKCSVCDYCAWNKALLYSHMKIHSGDKPFACNDCDYKAITKSALQKHFRTHTREKPFKCDECDYTAAQKSSLEKHIRTHTGEKPYQCPDCDYKAARKTHLQNHIRIHTGEKPFKCPDCDYRGSQKSSLLSHARTHAGTAEPNNIDV